MRNFTLSQVKAIQKKRTGKKKKVWGAVLLIFGLIMLEDVFKGGGVGSIIDFLIFAIPGAALLISGIAKPRKWDRYEAAVNQNGNTPVQHIADKVHEPVSKVRAELQVMINNNFFIGPNYDIDAYINGEYDMLVMTRNGKPLEDIEDTLAKKKKVSESFELKAVCEAINCIEDEEVKDCLYNLEKSVRKINAKLAESPELEDTANIRKLKSFYLPQTLTLIEKYREGLGSDETLAKIKEALKVCSEAFTGIERKLNENDDINTQVDIEVLKRTFEREGLLGSDFEL